MEENKTLYLVTTKASGSISGLIQYQTAYVVASGLDEAYKKVRDFLDKNNLCYTNERELDSIKPLANTYHYNNICTILFL